MSNRQFVQYHQRALATDPIAYWPLNERQGAVAHDWVSGRVAGAQNGTHNNVALLQPGIGDGFCCPFYDGANDWTNIHSAAFQAAFTSAQGTLAIWGRVDGAATWADGAVRRAVQLGVDGNNRIWLGKGAANNTLYGEYTAGGVVDAIVIGGVTTLGFFHLAITWDVNAPPTGEVRVYYNGVQSGATQVGLGVWVGNLNVVRTNIGADGNFPSAVWDGCLAHCAVWDRVLSAHEILDLYESGVSH